jgi:hypothetical protein
VVNLPVQRGNDEIRSTELQDRHRVRRLLNYSSARETLQKPTDFEPEIGIDTAAAIQSLPETFRRVYDP